MPKPNLSARIDERLDEKVEEIIEEEDMSSRSEATRFLVERGVRDWERTQGEAAESGLVQTLTTQIAAVLATFAFVLGVLTAFGLVGYYTGLSVASTLLAPAALIVVASYLGFFRAIDERLEQEPTEIGAGVTES
jgi:Arc/MetJ-type ribon-helix-helix transcriptional regulator